MRIYRIAQNMSEYDSWGDTAHQTPVQGKGIRINTPIVIAISNMDVGIKFADNRINTGIFIVRDAFSNLDRKIPSWRSAGTPVNDGETYVFRASAIITIRRSPYEISEIFINTEDDYLGAVGITPADIKQECHLNG